MKRIVIVMLCILAFVVACQKGDTYTITEPYQYPVVPGMEKWADLKSLQEKSEACQIAEDILTSMTTEALRPLCIIPCLAMHSHMILHKWGLVM